MSKQKDTLVVNGKIFDVSASSQTDTTALHSKNLDGFFKPVHHERSPLAKPAVHHSRSKITQARSLHTASEVHRRREHTKTLMRSAVAKPHQPKLAALAGRLETNGEAISIVSVPLWHAQQRHHRAKQTSKSSLISRFGTDLVEPKVHKKTLPLQVKHHPSEHVSGHSDSLLPVSLADKPTETESSSDLFTAALSRATSHEQPALKTKHHRLAKKLGVSRRTANLLASVAVVVVLGGFIAYQNVANIDLHMAAARAGVQATLPGYRPAGFALSRHIQTAPGQIIISFHSNSDSRNFKIIQKASDWDSQTLLDNYVAVNDSHYQRLSQDNGKTIFVYGDANATWVDGGVWYNIAGNSSLSNEQLLKLANSL